MREEPFNQTIRCVPHLYQLNEFVAQRLWRDIDSLKPMSPLFKADLMLFPGLAAPLP